ncbi:hypothetical protein A8E25_28990 [Burkholderia cenocepacia]|uniref:Uncharacterized protein n=2 Tax=Burkholderia cenocepacia TaxID=95486 RepID=B4EB52_BURCJ|nr:hypothetical protein WQ49_35130 [Burkholderia cenocepacia]CAR53267.1 hypothetical protein BCAL2962 [Burkholderia cenocepacia J2315]KKI79829.1 hypothetical protein WQ49_35210 [Burkholderia cenocepacia]KKI81662.1 hypothetical protein WQ49_14505 [Burkholderia cenocepacia]ONR55497.1 hypothetical protein A8E17_23995 [Burkholderia cenocepacia]
MLAVRARPAFAILSDPGLAGRGRHMGLLRWIFGGGKEAPREMPAARSNPVAIEPDAEMVREARDDADEVTRLLQSRIEASGLVVPGKIPELMTKLRGNIGLFQRTSIAGATQGDEPLSVGEKRALGLNTRMKYTREFVEFFRPEVLPTIEPKSALAQILDAVSFEVSRRRALTRFRKAGGGLVTIEPLGDPDACAAAKRLRRRLPLEEAPELPLPTCDADVCRCAFACEPRS